MTKSAQKKKVSADVFRKKLKVKGYKIKDKLYAKHPHVKKILAEKDVNLDKIRQHSMRLLGTGALTGALLLTPPDGSKALPAPHEIISKMKNQWKAVDTQIPQRILVSSLNEILPQKTRSLTRDEEKYLEQIIESTVGVKARAALEGEHLNTTYGLIGLEQHLRRFPGDTIGQHGEGEVLEEGMAPGLGAWGYFAPSKSQMTEDLEETERWYAVVQTLYLPDWGSRQPYLRDWYKYRKVLIVNTKNGQAVVAAIADAGPAAWTGKHFGGSPEVMDHLGGDRYTKGPVLLFFVDDPENEVPLGPVDYNNINLPAEALIEV